MQESFSIVQKLLDNTTPETYDAVTAVMREADEKFHTSGGSTRHYVRDLLLPLLEQAGIRLCRVS